MDADSVGLLNPGAMGASIGAAARVGDKTVYWVSEGRSEQSRERAEKAGLEDAGTLRDLVARCGMIISVCPPAAAVDVARSVTGLGFSGTYLDANAISPAHTREIAGIIKDSGGSYIDGSIIGGPAWKSGTTWMYVSGSHAEQAIRCFDGGPLTVVDLEGEIGAASAIKMAYASYTKGTKALLSAILTLAKKEGVLEHLLEQWELSQKDLAESAVDRVRKVTEKAWRFAGEMLEISQTFEDAGLPGGFHGAASEVYTKMAKFKDAPQTPSLEEVIEAVGE